MEGVGGEGRSGKVVRIRWVGRGKGKEWEGLREGMGRKYGRDGRGVGKLWEMRKGRSRRCVGEGCRTGVGRTKGRDVKGVWKLWEMRKGRSIGGALGWGVGDGGKGWEGCTEGVGAV